MKRRSSLRKAEHSINREGWYKEESEKILYERGAELTVDGQDVYIKDGERRTLLITVLNPKKLWYEIWLKLTKW